MNPEEILEAFQDARLNEANEAETRLKVIDEIIFGPLGWEKSEVSVEERVSEDGQTTFADYIFRTANSALVVEAKKAGSAELAVPREKKVSLTGNWLRGATGEAVIQARDYARKKGIPYAAVTDGSYWLIFPASRTDGISFEDSSCIIYPDIAATMKDEFSEFRDLLARENIINGSLDSYLVGSNKDQNIERRLNRHFDFAVAPKKSSPLYPFISDAILDAFTEDLIKRDAGTLAKCYVSTPQRRRFDNRIKMHVARRANPTGKSSIRALNARHKQAILDTFEAAARKTKPSAIMVLGPVGAGKTTFLHYTRNVSLKSSFDSEDRDARQHWIYIDFKDFTPGTSIDSFFITKIGEYIQEDEYLSNYDRCIKYAYKDKIEALFRGPLSLLADDERYKKEKITELLSSEYNKGQPYVEQLITYAASNRAVFVVFDNIDQISGLEEQAAIISSLLAFSSRTKASIILGLRGATYLKQKTTSVLDAFDYDPIVIDPPEVKPVLANRFFVARELLRDRPASFVSESGAKVEAQDVGVFIDIVRDSVLESRVSSIIDVLSAGDIRLALRMTREFLEFGYSEPAKALEVHEQGGRYILPQHEAIRAIMLGNSAVYDGEYSVIGNVFDSRRDRNTEQFLKLFVLQFFVCFASNTDDFIDASDVVENLGKLGFGELAVIDVLQKLHEERYIVTRSERPVSIDSGLTASRLGGRFLREYLTELTIIENMLMDTYIADAKIWSELREITQKIHANRDIVKRLNLRVDRAKVFYEYVAQRLEELLKVARKVPLSADWLHNFLRERQSSFDEGCLNVIASAERNYGNARRKKR